MAKQIETIRTENIGGIHAWGGVHAETQKNTQIRIHGVYSGREFDLTFRKGDTAEYDSYNLKYLGEVVAISDKCVTIKPRYGAGTRRLKLYEFIWRNYNFDLEKITAENAATSMEI